MRLYLAHPILIRKEVRELELKFEKETGIELFNPFYDTDREDIKPIDDGKTQPWDKKLDNDLIVESDIAEILKSDGLVAVFSEVLTIGTSMEMVITKLFNKPVYTITLYKPLLNHPWINYYSDFVYDSFKMLVELFSVWRPTND